MPDRRRRAALRLPLSDSGVGERGSLLLRERQSSSSSPPPQDDDNPFAAPPEGTPDRPWRPRRRGDSGNSGDSDQQEEQPDGSGEQQRPQGWGSQWSSRQPQRQNGGFGGGRRDDPNNNGQKDPGGRGEPGGGLRWDPTDPAQRRARYALLSGMWAFFFALFNMREIALLLGALALYWSISALRARPSDPEPGATNPPGPSNNPYSTTSKQQTTAAISGLVTASLAIVIVAANFTVELAYRDFYTCVGDSLTQTAELECNDLLPDPLEQWYGVKD
jgi:hypothetical protein